MPHNTVSGVKHLCRVYKEGSPFLLVSLLGKEGAGRVHRALYPGLEAGEQLRITAYILGLGASDLQDAFG